MGLISSSTNPNPFAVNQTLYFFDTNNGGTETIDPEKILKIAKLGLEGIMVGIRIKVNTLIEFHKVVSSIVELANRDSTIDISFGSVVRSPSYFEIEVSKKTGDIKEKDHEKSLFIERKADSTTIAISLETK